MKRLHILIVTLILSLPGYAQVDRTKIPKAGPAPEIKLSKPESFELKNGLKVIVVENHKLPRVAFNLVLDFEAVLEGDKAGYASMAGDLLRTGTTSKNKVQIDESVDFIGATLNTSASGIYAASLKKHQDALLDLMTDVLYNPSFPEEELEKIRKQTLSGLAAQKDDPGAIASNVRSVVLYGKDHPYGELTTEETVGNITIDDCKEFYNTYFTPEIGYLAIVGDINKKEAKKLAKKYFSQWENKPIQLPKFSSVAQPEKTKVALVDRSNSVQSEIRISYPIDLIKGDPDVIKAGLMNTILGGGSSGRLYLNLREDKGFTYGAYSGISSDMVVGNFLAYASVRNEVTDSAIVEFNNEMHRLIDEKVTADELASVKALRTGSFARSLESPQTIASYALNIQRYNLPEDYYSNYLKRLSAVTVDDIQEMAKKYIKPENAHIIVVGKGSEIATKLEQFGEVTYYDIYGNSYVPEKNPLPAGLTAAKVMDTYLDAIGGEETVRELKDVTMSMSADMQGRKLDFQFIKKAPGMYKQLVSMEGNVMSSQVFDGENLAISQMGQAVPADEATLKDMPFDAAIMSEIAIKDLGLQSKLLGVESIDGVNAYAVEVTKPSGKTVTYFYSVADGLKIRESQVAQGPQGEMAIDVDVSDYKEVNGIKFPHVVTMPMGPMKMKVVADEIIVNKGIEDSEFATK